MVNFSLNWSPIHTQKVYIVRTNKSKRTLQNAQFSPKLFTWFVKRDYSVTFYFRKSCDHFQNSLFWDSFTCSAYELKGQNLYCKERI